MAEQLWGGRFSKSTDEMINDFQASIDFDKRMYSEDIAGSIARLALSPWQTVMPLLPV